MILVVGLGNTGNNYTSTRHNAGFLALDAIFEHYNFSSWVHKSKFKADIASFESDLGRIILCKPTTFMNLSGSAVCSLSSFYKIPLDDVIVIHDDIDLPLGKLKYKIGGGAAGHNGLKSIDQLMGNDYHRIRIGIGKPQHAGYEVSDYVLSKFTEDEYKLIKTHLEFLAKNFMLVASKDFENFKNTLATKLQKI